MDMLEGDVELTEFEAIDVQSIKGVKQGANGFPILMMKGLAAPVAKGKRDCPKCEKTYDADHKGDKCENCGTKLPGADASKAADGKVDCPTCKGDGKIMGNKRDCPDCDAKGKVTPAKAKTLASKSLVRDIIAKAVGADGQVDEKPDIAGGTEVLGQIADLIISEATELKAGQAGEIDDIFQLARAAEMIWCWRTGEQAVASGSIMPADMLMQAAAKSLDLSTEQWADWVDVIKADLSGKEINDLPDSAFAYIEDGGKKDDEGKTTPRKLRHFPVHDKPHAKNALDRLSSSPFGDKASAKVHAAAKKFGIDSDTSKSRIAEEGPDVDTVTQGTGSLSKAVEDAVTKAIGPLKERITALDAELAKVKATPVPGGPVLSRNVQVKQPGGVQNEDLAAKAALYRAKADAATDPADREGYRQLARETEEKARTATSA
jgi:hypothetical protein